MLKIKNTPNLLGISIHGDYYDLKTLYDSMHRYLNFYFSNLPFSSVEEEEMYLGLCYDIRHAFQGDRNAETVDNNAENYMMLGSNIYELPPHVKSHISKIRNEHQHGNLYYSVEIYYPWALYYLYGFQSMLDEWYDNEWFSHLDYPYTPLDAEYDRGILQVFTAALWKTLKDAVGEKTFRCLWAYKQEEEYPELIAYPEPYIFWLCCHYFSVTPDKARRKISLRTLCFLMVGIESDSLTELFDGEIEHPQTPYEQAKKQYKLNIKKLNEISSVPLMDFHSFCSEMENFYTENQNACEELFEDMLENRYFHSIDWDNPNW